MLDLLHEHLGQKHDHPQVIAPVFTLTKGREPRQPHVAPMLQSALLHLMLIEVCSRATGDIPKSVPGLTNEFCMWSKKIMVALALFTASLSASAASANGVLSATGGTSGFDFRYPSVFSKTVPTPGTAPIKLQSRFTWAPTTSMSDHAVVAYVQGSNNAFFNSEPPGFKSTIWRYGAGAFVAANGLNLELWFNPQNTAAGSAYAWNHEDLCGVAVNSDPISVCLEDTYSVGGAYVEPLPANWSFVPGHHYWVRITITPTTGDWLNLYAELYHDNLSTTTLVQRAQIGFQKSAFLPLSTSVKGAVARAPGSGVNINWHAFDSF